MKSQRRNARTQFRYTTYEDDIGQERPVRLIDMFVDALDFEKLKIRGEGNIASTGRPKEFYSSDLLKLIIFGARYQLDSARDMAEACKLNVEVRWLMHGTTPSHTAISEFRKQNIGCFEQVFYAFTDMVIREKGLSFQTLDGSKFKANNGKDANYTLSKLDDRILWKQRDLKDLERRIRRHEPKYVLPAVKPVQYQPEAIQSRKAKDPEDSFQLSIEGMEECLKDITQSLGEEEEAIAEEEDEIDEKTKQELDHLKAKVQEKSALLAVHLGYREYMEENGLTQLSLTDPTSKLMKSKNGYMVAYNVQALVDASMHLITELLVITNANDVGQLYPIGSKLKQRYPDLLFHIVTDKGYQSSDDMMECLEHGIIPHVIPDLGNDYYEVECRYEEAEITDAQKASTKPEDLACCLQAGVIPAVYAEVLSCAEIKTTNVFAYTYPNNVADMTEEQMREKAAEGFYIRDLDSDRVYCPAGVILRKKSEKRNGSINYANKKACKECKYRQAGYCVRGKSEFKEVNFADKVTISLCKNWMQADEEEHIVTDENGKETTVEIVNPRRKRKKVGTKTVVSYHLTPDRGRTEKRFSIAEHPFGTMKTTLNRDSYNLRGLHKVKGEHALTALAYNMIIAYNLLGFDKLKALIEKLAEEKKRTVVPSPDTI